jgi:hypothetical protein
MTFSTYMLARGSDGTVQNAIADLAAQLREQILLESSYDIVPGPRFARGSLARDAPIGVAIDGIGRVFIAWYWIAVSIEKRDIGWRRLLETSLGGEVGKQVRLVVIVAGVFLALKISSGSGGP